MLSCTQLLLLMLFTAQDSMELSYTLQMATSSTSFCKT